MMKNKDAKMLYKYKERFSGGAQRRRSVLTQLIKNKSKIYKRSQKIIESNFKW
jgi:hypothetical protein